MADLADKFSVQYDARANRLRWTMRGFWSVADVAAFIDALRAALTPLGPPPRRFDGLGDSTRFPVQSTEVSAALAQIDVFGNAMRKGRLAIVVAGTINKLQVERTILSDGVRVFLSVEDAEAWLQQTPMEQA